MTALRASETCRSSDTSRSSAPASSSSESAGEFEIVAPPHRLVYTWRAEPGSEAPERVTVTFEPREGATEVVVVHERIPDAPTRDRHREGWQGCLDGLAEYLDRKS